MTYSPETAISSAMSCSTWRYLPQRGHEGQIEADRAREEPCPSAAIGRPKPATTAAAAVCLQEMTMRERVVEALSQFVETPLICSIPLIDATRAERRDREVAQPEVPPCQTPRFVSSTSKWAHCHNSAPSLRRVALSPISDCCDHTGVERSGALKGCTNRNADRKENCAAPESSHSLSLAAVFAASAWTR